MRSDRDPRVPIDQLVSRLACPKCGDENMGYRFRMTETHDMQGVWGKSAEAGDSGMDVRESLAECNACGARFHLASLRKRGLAG